MSFGAGISCLGDGMMKASFFRVPSIILFLLLLCVFLLNADMSYAAMANLTNRTQYKDLNYWERWLCEHASVSDFLSEHSLNTLYDRYVSGVMVSGVLTPISYITGKSVTGRGDYCAAAIDTLNMMRNINEITEPYEVYSGKNATQIGLEEYFFEEEKQLILVNTNTVWDYIKLVFNMVIEVILIAFYMVQLYLFIYIVFVVIPKVFLKIRDSVAETFLKHYRKKKNIRR